MRAPRGIHREVCLRVLAWTLTHGNRVRGFCTTISLKAFTPWNTVICLCTTISLDTHPVEYCDMSVYDYQPEHSPSGIQSYVCVRLSAWTFTQWNTATGLRTTISLDTKGFLSKCAVLKIDLLYAGPEHFVFAGVCLALFSPSEGQWEGCVSLSAWTVTQWNTVGGLRTTIRKLSNWQRTSGRIITQWDTVRGFCTTISLDIFNLDSYPKEYS